jgi:hypothetical protein
LPLLNHLFAARAYTNAMNKLVPLLLFTSILAASCSSSYAPSIDVGDNRIAINTAMMGSSDLSASDAASPIPTSYGTLEDSITEIDMTIGRVVAENLEIGGTVMMKNVESEYSDSLKLEEGKMNALGVYARYYFPTSLIGGSDTFIGGDAKLVPWLQGAVTFSGTGEGTNKLENGVIDSQWESDVFITSLSAGFTSFYSENAAIEFAITQKTVETDDYSGLLGGDDFPAEFATEETSRNFTLGLSLTF